MNDALIRLKVSTQAPAIAWADGMQVSMPKALAARMGPRDGVLRVTEEHCADTSIVAEAAAAARDLRERAAFIETPPAVSKSPISYRTVPGPARMIIARMLGSWKRMRQDSWASFPGWPIDLSADFLADLAQVESQRNVAAETPVLLTHDIDSPEGLENLTDRFLDIEEKYGARSCNYVVPCAWPLDEARLSAARARGHEIGVHGFDHSNRTPFLSAEERRDRLARGAAFGKKWGAAGYRAPSLVRNRALLDGLQPHYLYDSSIPTAGGAFPVGNNGSATARPYPIGALWEIPLSLPRDGSLRFLGYSPKEIGDLWLACADRIARSGGVVCLLTHCENSFSGNVEMLAVYERTLEALARDKRFRFVLPRDLVLGLGAEQGRAA